MKRHVSSSRPHEAERRPGQWALAVSLTLVFLSASAFWVYSGAWFGQAAAAAPKRFADARSYSYPPDFYTYERQGLVLRPLDQERLNGVLVYGRSATPPDAERLTKLMSKFAWRTAAGQQNLIAAAAERRDFAQLFKHSEALLRRGKLTNEVFALFSLMETLPDQRAAIVEALAKEPEWRAQYLTQREALVSPVQVEARYATLQELRRKTPLARSELSALLFRMVALDQSARAHALWRDTARANAAADTAFDSAFRVAAASASQGGKADIPFEWQLNSGSTAGALVSRRNGATELDLYWNGQGVPIFLRQTFAGRQGRYRVIVGGVLADTLARRALTVELACPRSRPLELTRVEARRADQLVFETSTATSCGFPELRVLGRTERVISDFELSLTSVTVQRLS
jgi:hypothetical protein